MANYSYETLLNDNVRFLQGTQADLNKYLLNYTPGTGEDDIRGTAIEGAFYLTTDTHRLYVGRKITTAGTDQNKIVPVQVSAGITTVVNTGQLPAASVDAQKGDFYYIQDGNILAVLEEDPNTGAKEWVQINGATEISGFSQSTSTATGHNDTVLINSSVATTAGSQDCSVGLVEGDNITLTPSTTTIGSTTISTIEIDAVDTTYAIGATAETVNGAPIGLKKDSGSTLDSSITVTGTNDIAVTSTAAGAVNVIGPNYTNKGVAAEAVSTGFLFNLEYVSGDSSEGSKTFTHSTKSTLDPTITYGATSGYSVPSSAVSFSTATPVHFLNGNATLDVYTKAQSDQAITDAVNAKLAEADAMTYKGTIKNLASNTDVTATTAMDTIQSSGTVKNGDTYKAACDFIYNGISVKTGDLIIFRGTETNGVITSGLTADIVPSGDEPFIAPGFSGDGAGTYDAVTPYGTSGSTTTATILNLVDSKNSNSLIASTIIPNTEKIQVTSTITNNNTATLNIEHRTLTRSDTTNLNLTSSSATDTIGDNGVTLFVLGSANGIATDSYGHVTGVTGKTITFKHNKLSNMITGYNDATLASGSTLLSKAYANITTTDSYATVSTPVSLESKTLVIASNNAQATADQALSIDIKWDSF